MNTKRKLLPLIAATFGVMALGACSTGPTYDDQTAGTQGSPADSAESTESTDSAKEADTAESAESAGCFVHLFDGDDFDEGDSNFKLTKPGKYEDLSNLPGADEDWTDDADSLKVGPDATVTIWSEPGFSGTATKLEAGSEEPDLDDEPESLELVCN